MCQPVSTRDEAGHASCITSRDDAMDEHATILRKKDDVAKRNFFEANPLDGNQVTVQEGRRHARAENTAADLAKRANGFFQQTL